MDLYRIHESTNPNVKWCKRCKSWQRRENFYKLSSSTDGLRTYCKACDKKISSDGYRSRKDRLSNDSE